MNKNDLDRKISKVLGEGETFILTLILLSQMTNDDRYR